jgi:hypothetical protein
MAAFSAELDKHLSATAVWKVAIDTITGKRRQYP